MLGDISPQTVRITQQAVVYPGRDHVTSLRVERFDGRTYKPVDMTAVTRVILSFPEADPVIVYDSSVQAVFTHVGSVLTVDLSDYAMPASVLGCQIILYDAEHPAGQVLVDDIDAVVQFEFRNVNTTGGIPAPAVDYLTDAPIDGVLYGRRDGIWVPIDDVVSGVSSVNGETGTVVLDAVDVGADPAGTGASAAAAAVAAHVADADPHLQYTTIAEAAAASPVQSVNGETGDVALGAGDVGADPIGTAASVMASHDAELDPHPQYNTQAEGDARYERNLTAGANITIDRTNPAAPVISASGGGGGGGAVDSVNGQTGVVVLDTDDIAEGVSNLYFTNGRAAAAAPVQTVDGQAGAVSLSSSYAPLSHVGAGGAAHSNAVAAGAAGFMTGADKTKLDGIATGATQNSSDATLLARANHTGTQTASTISDFNSATRAQVEAELVAGANVTITPSGTGATRQLTIASTGSGGVSSVSGTAPIVSSGGATPAISIDAATTSLPGSMSAADKTKLNGIATGAQVNVPTDLSLGTITATAIPVNSSTGADISLPVATTSLAGLQSAADKTKLDGVATGATQNSSDAFLRARGNHTGTQLASTISDFTEAAQDVVGASVVAGDNATVTYDDGTGLTTVAAKLPVVRAITANETLALTNINTFGVNSTTSNYVSTIPAQATVAWTADAELHLLPSNTGDITITAAAGVSLNGVVAGSLTLSTQNGAATLKRTGADSWWLGGVIGPDQTWQNVAGSRALGTTYTNTTGRPIQAFALLDCSPGVTNGAQFVVDGVFQDYTYSYRGGTGEQQGVRATIPSGSSYSVVALGATVTLNTWMELR